MSEFRRLWFGLFSRLSILVRWRISLLFALRMDEDNIPRLLVIDDEPQLLELIKNALLDSGLEILTANGAAEGLERFKQTRPRIILLNLMLPGVRGLGMLNSILSID